MTSPRKDRFNSPRSHEKEHCDVPLPISSSAIDADGVPLPLLDSTPTKRTTRWTPLKEGRIETDRIDEEVFAAQEVCPGLIQALAKDVAAIKSKGLTPEPWALASIAAIDKDEDLRKWLDLTGPCAMSELKFQGEVVMNSALVVPVQSKGGTSKIDPGARLESISDCRKDSTESKHDIGSIHKKEHVLSTTGQLTGTQKATKLFMFIEPTEPAMKDSDAAIALFPFNNATTSTSKTRVLDPLSVFARPTDITAKQSNEVLCVKATKINHNSGSKATPEIEKTHDSSLEDQKVSPGVYTMSEIVVIVVGAAPMQKKFYIHEDLLTSSSGTIASKFARPKHGYQGILELRLPTVDHHIFVALVDCLYQERVKMYVESCPLKGPSNARDLLRAWILAADLGMEKVQNAVMDCLRASLAKDSPKRADRFVSYDTLDSSTVVRDLVDEVQCQSIPLRRATPPYDFVIDQVVYNLLNTPIPLGPEAVATLDEKLEGIMRAGGDVAADILARVISSRSRDLVGNSINPSTVPGCRYHAHSTLESKTRCEIAMNPFLGQLPTKLVSDADSGVVKGQQLFSAPSVMKQEHGARGSFPHDKERRPAPNHVEFLDSGNISPGQQIFPIRANTDFLRGRNAMLNSGKTSASSSTHTLSHQLVRNQIDPSMNPNTKLSAGFFQSSPVLPSVSWDKCSGTSGFAYLAREESCPDGKLVYQSISASILHEQFSVEELRLADYKAGRSVNAPLVSNDSNSTPTSGLIFSFPKDRTKNFNSADMKGVNIDLEDDDEEL